MENFEDYIEQVKEANPIEDVIEESGYQLGGGLYRRGKGKDFDSLVVNVNRQLFVWNSRIGEGWSGDVYTWVEREKGYDFKGALEFLAKRAGMPMPEWKPVNESEVKKSRTTTSVFEVASIVFQRWLRGDEEKKIMPDVEAMDYCRSRGWTDETINAVGVGFSGRGQAWQIQDMTGEFALYGIDTQCPQAAAVLGFNGDVKKWAEKWGLLDDPDFNKDWISKGKIHGLMGTPGLIYVHQLNGQVKYLTRRQLPGFDVIKEDKKEREWKSFNPQKCLVGPRQPYFNQVYRRDKRCVIVEGQADAITLDQWGEGGVALCGLSTGDEGMNRLVAYLKKNPTKYLGLDMDEPGQANRWKIAKMFGPMVRMVSWPDVMKDGEE